MIPAFMDLPDMLFLFVACFGLWGIVGWSKISLRPRRWLGDHGTVGAWLVELLECPQCFGVWTGFVFGVFSSELFTAQTSSLARAVTMACMCGGSNLILGKLTGLMQTAPHTAADADEALQNWIDAVRMEMGFVVEITSKFPVVLVEPGSRPPFMDGESIRVGEKWVSPAGYHHP